MLNDTRLTGEDISHAFSIAKMDSIDRSILDEDKDTTLQEVIASGTDDYEAYLEEEHIFETIYQVSQSLKNELHKNIWEEWIYALYYGEKLNQDYFSSKYHCSQAQVSRILRNCKKLFVNMLSSEDGKS